MRDPTRRIAALAVASLGLLAVACNKRPAEDALAVAGQQLAAAKPDLEKYAPDELASLAATAQQARGQLDQGHYTDALKAALGLPSRIREAAAVAAAKKEQLVAAWAEISLHLPGTVEGLTARVAELEAAQKLPKGMDEAGFAAARADLESLTRAWSEAAAAFQRGDVPGAVRTAREVEAKAEALAGMLGRAAPPAPAKPGPPSSRPDIIGPSGPGPGSSP